MIAGSPRSTSSCTTSGGPSASSSSWPCSSSSSTPVVAILELRLKLFQCTLHLLLRLSTSPPTRQRETCGPSFPQFLLGLAKLLESQILTPDWFETWFHK